MPFLSLLSLILIVRQGPGFQNVVSLLSRSHAFLACCLTKLRVPEHRAQRVLLPQKLMPSVLSVTQQEQQALVGLWQAREGKTKQSQVAEQAPLGRRLLLSLECDMWHWLQHGLEVAKGMPISNGPSSTQSGFLQLIFSSFFPCFPFSSFFGEADFMTHGIK